MYKISIVFFVVLLLAFATGTQAGMSEEAKIERLISAVENMPEGTRFIRNGSAHDSARAAAHLRTKYKNAKKYAGTAKAFIENLASKSSLSGKGYSIQYSDGKTVTARDFFMEELKKIGKEEKSSEK